MKTSQWRTNRVSEVDEDRKAFVFKVFNDMKLSISTLVRSNGAPCDFDAELSIVFPEQRVFETMAVLTPTKNPPPEPPYVVAVSKPHQSDPSVRPNKKLLDVVGKQTNPISKLRREENHVSFWAVIFSIYFGQEVNKWQEWL